MNAPEGRIFRSITSDGKGRIFLLISDFGSQPGKEIAVMDAEGHEVDRYLLPKKCVQIRANGAGSLFVVPRERDAIVIYRTGIGKR